MHSRSLAVWIGDFLVRISFEKVLLSTVRLPDIIWIIGAFSSVVNLVKRFFTINWKSEAFRTAFFQKPFRCNAECAAPQSTLLQTSLKRVLRKIGLPWLVPGLLNYATPRHYAITPSVSFKV